MSTPIETAAEAMEDAALSLIGRDLGTLHRNDIARAALASLAQHRDDIAEAMRESDGLRWSLTDYGRCADAVLAYLTREAS